MMRLRPIRPRLKRQSAARHPLAGYDVVIELDPDGVEVILVDDGVDGGRGTRRLELRSATDSIHIDILIADPLALLRDLQEGVDWLAGGR